MSLIVKHAHQSQLPGVHERLLRRAVIAGQVGIAVDRAERIAQQGQGAAKGAGGAQQLRPIEGILHLQSIAAAIAGELANPFAQKSHAQHHTFETAAGEQAKLVGKKRFASDLDQRLRDGFGDGPQSRGEPPSQDGDRQHGLRNGPPA